MEKKIKSYLIESNDVRITPEGVWSTCVDGDFDYSDGDASEESIQTILAKSKDRSSLSIELEKSSYDWISYYHLSSERQNIYRFFNLAGIETGLELGAGCGAITRYLGEQDIILDSVEGSKRRADICKLRCEDLENVEIVHSNFNDLDLPKQKYNALFLNGVLEYAGKFEQDCEDDETALTEVLKKGLGTLTEDGIAFIAIENRDGLKYWLGAKEDHYGAPYVGLYNYPGTEGIRTYDKRKWSTILNSLKGDYKFKFVYPFPDYKMAKTIISDDFVKNNPFAYSHLYRVASTENGSPLVGDLNEFLMWKSLHEEHRLEDYANSFVILISKDSKRLEEVCCNDFIHFSGKGRKPEYRTYTKKIKDSDEVDKIYLHDIPRKCDIFQHDLSPGSYTKGTLLVTKWLESLHSGESQKFEQEIRDYFEFIREKLATTEEKGCYFDSLPFNIIIKDDGSWSIIDKEWVVNFDLTPEYLLFRSLFWFPSGNESLLETFLSTKKITTFKEFIGYFFELLNLELDENIESFVKNEENTQEKITEQVRSNPVENKLLQPIISKSVAKQALSFLAQLYWKDDEGSWSEDKSLFEQAKLGQDKQTLTFTLPPTNEPITFLRFDPSDRSGFFRLFNLTITSIDRNKDDQVELFSLSGVDEIGDYAELVNVEYCKNGLGELFVATNNDPYLVLALNENVQEQIKEKGVTFSVQMDWPKSTDFIVAMDSLGRKVVEQNAKIERLEIIESQSKEQVKRISSQAVRLKETSDQVRAKDIYIENIEREIEAMRQTRVWRMAEYLRIKIYYRLLDTKTLVQKSLKTLKNEGLGQFIRKTRQHLSKQPDSEILGLTKDDYNLWVEHNKLTDYDIEEIKNNIKEFSIKPLFSIIVPVYDVDQEWLERTIQSVQNQLYDNWELCLCDDLSPSPHIKQVLQQYRELDSRIKVMFKEKNEGIALTTNAALTMATGDYIGLLDHDDELSIDALYENAKIINKDPSAGLIYSDEDKLDMQGRRCDPFFKPDYSPELIRSQNYICHFTVIKKSIIEELKGFRKGYDGSQDHDLILRSLDKTKRVYHIPKILYHWRKIPGSTAAVYDSKSYAWEAGRKAVLGALEREGAEGNVVFAKYQGSYRASYDVTDNPLISIIIPFKDKAKLLNDVITSILEKSTYQNFEIIGVSNNSEAKETEAVVEKLKKKDSRVKFIEYNIPFNYSAINNHAVEKASGDYVLLLNNDMEVIAEEWLEALLQLAQKDDIGVVGGRLYYPDNRIQHAGIVIGMAGVAGPPHYLFHRDDVGYYARSHVIHNVSAVTGACLMVSKKLYQEVGGLDEDNFGVAYNDIDFCLKLIQRGYRNVYTPYCELYHYESQSRGYDDTPEKIERLETESAAFRERWKEYFEKGDPYYSPHLSLDTTNFSIKLKN